MAEPDYAEMPSMAVAFHGPSRTTTWWSTGGVCRIERDDLIKIDLDPEVALRALLNVDPGFEPALKWRKVKRSAKRDAE
jgi:hypothetical protein